MQTVEPAYTREATEILVKIIDSAYEKADLKQVADNVTQMNSEKITQLLFLLLLLLGWPPCPNGMCIVGR